MVTTSEWHEHLENLCTLAEWLHLRGKLVNAQEMLDFFIHPQRWVYEWRELQEELAASAV